MITPAYAPTATERVLPRLALDFTTGVLDPRVTVARALNTATRVNSSGLIEGVNANLPRFDYDRATLDPKGLLIEETRANLFLQSVFPNGGNTPTGWTRILGSDGMSSPSTLLATGSGAYTFVASNNRQIILQTISASINTTYTITVYVESVVGSVQRTDIMTVSAAPTGATITQPSAGLATSGERITATVVVGATAGSISVRLGAGCSANTTGTVRISAPQIEAGAFATSYIPTTTTSLTRNADVVSMTGTNFSDWYNASEGTFVARFLSYIGASVNNPRILAVSDGSTANRLRSFLATTNTTTQVNSGGVSQASLNNTPSTLYGTFNKLAIGYKADRFVTAINGGAVSSDLSGSVPVAPIRLNIGADFDAAAATQLNGYLSLLNYYPQCLTNAETQAFSK